jgi:hypothetical protein
MMSLLLESAVRSLALGIVLWLGLGLLRVRSPAVKSLVWTVALIASLAMPALVTGMQQTAPALPAAALPYVPGPILQALEPVAVQPLAAAPAASPAPTFHWAGLLPYAYGAGAAVLLIRLLAGLFLTWRLMRTAQPLEDAADVRLSPAITVPVTFGRAILLPADASGWSTAKREAVLAHERAHLARGDFAVHLLAKLNRAVFWFNPFAWWLDIELAELAEAASDDIAVTEVGVPLSYAEILLDVAGSAGRVPAGVAMARSGMVTQRIERVIAGIRFPRIGRKAAAMIVAELLPLVAAAAITVAAPADETATPIDPKTIDRYVGAYEFDPAKAPNQVLNVTRDGDRLFVDNGAGSPKIEMFQKSDGMFFEKGIDNEIDFPQGSGPAPSLLLVLQGHRPGHEAKRVDQAEAARVAALIEQRRKDEAKPHTAITVDPATFDAYVGYYRFDRIFFNVTRENDYLFVKVGANPRLRAIPDGPHDFFFREAEVELSFPADGKQADKMVFRQNGRELIATRIDEAAYKAGKEEVDKRLADEARPRTPATIDPKLLDNYTGRFQMAPGMIFAITREGDGLMAKLKDQPAFPIYPENDHTFFYTVVPAQITFITGKDGRATELVLHQNGQDIPASRIE